MKNNKTNKTLTPIKLIDKYINTIEENKEVLNEYVERVYKSEDMYDFETNVIDNAKVFVEFDDQVIKTAFWQKYQLELMPINYDLNFICEDVWDLINYDSYKFNVIYSDKVNRYFLSLEAIKDAYKRNASSEVKILFGHYDKALVEEIKSRLEKLAIESNDFHNFYEDASREGIYVYDKFLEILLKGIEFKDKSKYFVDKLNYDGDYNKAYVYYEDSDELDDSDDESDIDKILYVIDDIINENRGEFDKINRKVNTIKSFKEYSDFINSIKYVDNNDDYKIFNDVTTFQFIYPLYFSSITNKELFTLDIKIVFGLFKLFVLLDYDKREYFDYYIEYAEEYKSYILFVSTSINNSKFEYDFIATHINEEILHSIAKYIDKFLTSKQKIEHKDIKELANKMFESIKDESKYYFAGQFDDYPFKD